jgi:hypothetical protein
MGSPVDLIVTAVVAVLVMIVAVLVATIRKKRIGKISLYVEIQGTQEAGFRRRAGD